MKKFGSLFEEFLTSYKKGFDEQKDEQLILSKIWSELFISYENEPVKNILLKTQFVSWNKGIIIIKGIGASERFLITMEENRILAHINNNLSKQMSKSPEKTTTLIIR